VLLERGQNIFGISIEFGKTEVRARYLWTVWAWQPCESNWQYKFGKHDRVKNAESRLKTL